MTHSFLSEVNQLISEATWDVPDDEISSDSDVSSEEFTSQFISVNTAIQQFIVSSRNSRLKRMRLAFLEAKNKKEVVKQVYRATRSVEDMLSEIVRVIASSENVPNGLLIGFREQSQNGSEDGIKKIWEDLVDLGLINPDGNES